MNTIAQPASSADDTSTSAPLPDTSYSSIRVTGASRTDRIRKGQRNQSIDQLQSSLPFDKLSESPFQAQELLAHLIHQDLHDIEAIVHVPTLQGSAKGKGKEKESEGTEEGQAIDSRAWLYESLRRLCQDLNTPWLPALQQSCTRQSCGEMKGGEWLYLCAAHASATETECCAIDYIEHTLNAATALLVSPKHFPSRLNLPDSSFKHLASTARRLYRIFSHAYYHHPETFHTCEAETSLYTRFKRTVILHDLLPDEILAVPASFDPEPEEQGRNAIEEDQSSANNER